MITLEYTSQILVCLPEIVSFPRVLLILLGKLILPLTAVSTISGGLGRCVAGGLSNVCQLWLLPAACNKKDPNAFTAGIDQIQPNEYFYYLYIYICTILIYMIQIYST